MHINIKYLYLCLYLYLHLHLYPYLYLSIYLSINLSIYPSTIHIINLSVYLSIPRLCIQWMGTSFRGNCVCIWGTKLIGTKKIAIKRLEDNKGWQTHHWGLRIWSWFLISFACERFQKPTIWVILIIAPIPPA